MPGIFTLGIVASSLHMGGAEQLLREFLRRLDRNRFSPRLYLLGEPGPIGQEIMDLGVPCRAHIQRGRFDPWAAVRLAHSMAEDNVQGLLLINHRNAMFYGVLAARLAGLSTVVNWENETFKRYRGHDAFMALRRMLMWGVDAAVAAAEGHANYIVDEEHVPLRKVVPIPNCVDPGRFRSNLDMEEAKARLGVPAGRKTVGILAVLRPDKAHEVFLEAAARVVATGQDVHFLIIGDGPRRAALEALTEQLGLADRVSFLGFRRDLADIFAALDLAALASKPQQETLSVAALEIMSAGVPMVATRVGFMAEIVIPGRTGLLVEPEDAHGLAQGMAELLADDPTRQAMGKRARDMVARQYDLDGMTRRFEDLFDDVLAGKAVRHGRLNLSRTRLCLVVSWREEGEWELLRGLRRHLAKVDVLCPEFKTPSGKKWGRLAPLVQAAKAVRLAERYDVLVSWSTPQGVCLGLMLRLVPKRLRPLHVVRDFHLDPTRTDCAYRLRLWLLRRALPCMDILWCTSQAETLFYAELLGISKERVAFFPDDPPRQFLEHPRTPPGGYVFSYGNSDRDFETLVRAARGLDREVVILTQAYALEGALPANVRVLRHRVDEAELISLIAGAAVVVVPLASRNVAAGQNVMLEAMSLARPVVATANVATLEYSVEGDSAVFFEPGDERELRCKLMTLLDNPSIGEAMGTRGRQRAQDLLASLPYRFMGLLAPWLG